MSAALCALPRLEEGDLDGSDVGSDQQVDGSPMRGTDDPLEYIALDALHDLPDGVAQRMMRSLRLSSRRVERTEQLVLKLQGQLQALEALGAASAGRQVSQPLPAAGCSVEIERKAMFTPSCLMLRWLLLVCVCCLVASLVGVFVTVFATRRSWIAELEGKRIHSESHAQELDVPQSTCTGAGCATVLPIEDQAVRCDAPERGVSSEVEERKLSSLLAQKLKCEATVRRLNATFPALLCVIDSAGGCDVFPTSTTSKAPSAPMTAARRPDSVDALGRINAQQAQIARLEAERAALLSQRDACMGCLERLGASSGCAEVRRIAAAPSHKPNVATPALLVGCNDTDASKCGEQNLLDEQSTNASATCQSC